MKHPWSRGIIIFLWLCPLAGILLMGCLSFHGGDRLPSPNPQQAQIDALAARVVTLEGEVKELKAKLKYMVTDSITGEFASVSGGHIENYLSNTD